MENKNFKKVTGTLHQFVDMSGNETNASALIGAVLLNEKRERIGVVTKVESENWEGIVKVNEFPDIIPDCSINIEHETLEAR